jgi:hypothetical protein
MFGIELLSKLGNRNFTNCPATMHMHSTLHLQQEGGHLAVVLELSPKFRLQTQLPAVLIDPDVENRASTVPKHPKRSVVFFWGRRRIPARRAAQTQAGVPSFC